MSDEHPRPDSRDEHWISRCLAHSKRMDWMEELLLAVDKWRRGNGKNGAEARIVLMEESLPEMKKDLAWIKRTLWVGIGALFVLQPLITKIIEHMTEGKP